MFQPDQRCCGLWQVGLNTLFRSCLVLTAILRVADGDANVQGTPAQAKKRSHEQLSDSVGTPPTRQSVRLANKSRKVWPSNA